MKNFVLLALTIFSFNLNAQTWEDCNEGLVDKVIQHINEVGNDFYCSTTNGLYISKDNGSNWMRAANGLESYNVSKVKWVGNLVFATTYGWGKIYKSLDSGKKFELLPFDIGSIEFFDLVTNGKDIFVGTFGKGVYHSGDLGATWTQVNKGLGDLRIMSMEISGDTLYAGTYGPGVFISTNKGQEWSSLQLSGVIFDILRKGDKIYATPQSSGVVLSNDRGLSWSESNNGLSFKWIVEMAIKDRMIALGTFGGGVYISFDEGLSWVNITYNIPSKNLIAVYFKDNYLFAGTQSRGLFKFDLTRLSAEDDGQKLLNLYPNPADNHINITGFDELSEYQIIDLTGKILQFGSIRDNSLDVSHLPSGVYFLNIRTQNENLIKSFVKY